jgi:hypothetical protein
LCIVSYVWMLWNGKLKQKKKKNTVEGSSCWMLFIWNHMLQLDGVMKNRSLVCVALFKIDPQN